MKKNRLEFKVITSSSILMINNNWENHSCMDLEYEKKIRKIDEPVHFCGVCNKFWLCNCMMCVEDKRMMCVACWNEFCSGGVDYKDLPPQFVENEFC